MRLQSSPGPALTIYKPFAQSLRHKPYTIQSITNGMEQNPPVSAWTEIQIDNDSISLTLVTEGPDGTKVEDTERFTFDELQDKAGAIESLKLSTETKETMREAQQELNDLEAKRLIAEMESDDNLPSEGDILIDKGSPSWSNDDRVRVVEVLENTTCDEQLIDMDQGLGSLFKKSVAQANPSYPDDDCVIVAEYVDDPTKNYYFPESRLVKED